MGSGTIIGNVSIAGVGFPVSITASDEGSILQQAAVPMAYAAEVTSGVGTKAGVITTTNPAPVITTDDWVDIYWTLLGVNYVLYNADVFSVVAGAVTIVATNGLGDNLPANGTACIIAVRKIIITAFSGTDVSMMGVGCSSGRSHVAFVSSATPASAIERFAHDIPDGEGWFFSDTMGFTHPITGYAIAAIFVSTANTSSNQTMSVGILYDSVA